MKTIKLSFLIRGEQTRVQQSSDSNSHLSEQLCLRLYQPNNKSVGSDGKDSMKNKEEHNKEDRIKEKDIKNNIFGVENEIRERNQCGSWQVLSPPRVCWS